MKLTLLFFIVALCASAQTNQPYTPAQNTQGQTNQSLETAQHIEEIRAACIQERRQISGRILKVLADGLIVDSGYTNLTRAPLDHSWLVPRAALAERATNVVEQNQPDAMCIGQVFLTDLPKTPGAKPKVFDYVNLEAFPAGQYSYTSVGDVHRTVRRFSAKLLNAVQWKLDQSPPTGWGAVACNVQIAISATKTNSQLGLSVAVMNLSANQIEINEPDLRPPIYFTITSPSGADFSIQEKPLSQGLHSTTFTEIAPGRSTDYFFPFNTLCKVNEIGVWKFTAQFKTYSSGKPCYAASQTLELPVTKR